MPDQPGAAKPSRSDDTACRKRRAGPIVNASHRRLWARGQTAAKAISTHFSLAEAGCYTRSLNHLRRRRTGRSDKTPMSRSSGGSRYSKQSGDVGSAAYALSEFEMDHAHAVPKPHSHEAVPSTRPLQGSCSVPLSRTYSRRAVHAAMMYAAAHTKRERPRQRPTASRMRSGGPRYGEGATKLPEGAAPQNMPTQSRADCAPEIAIASSRHKPLCHGDDHQSKHHNDDKSPGPATAINRPGLNQTIL